MKNIHELIKDLEQELALDLKDNISIYVEPHVYYNPDAYYHPASLLKLFIAIRAEELKDLHPNSEELFRAIKASLSVSDNDALGYLVDFISDTNSGLEFSPEDHLGLEEFKTKRSKINDYFLAKGYSKNINLANKCFSFNSYGRDRQLREALQKDFQRLGQTYNLAGANQVCLGDVVKVMQDIRKIPRLYEFLKRDFQPGLITLPHSQERSLDYQTYNFIGFARYQSETEPQVFYSKAGWNSSVRHDAAFIRMASEQGLMIILTKNLSHRVDLIPKLASLEF